MRYTTTLSMFLSVCGMFGATAFAAGSGTVPLETTVKQDPTSTANPWIGTWLLDTSHSKYSPGPPHKSARMSVTDVGLGKLAYVIDITDSAGEKEHSEFTCAMDQTECLVTNGGAKETVSISKLGSLSVQFNWKFNGPPPFSVTMRVKMSQDGKTQVSTSKGTLPDGTALAVTEVWRKS